MKKFTTIAASQQPKRAYKKPKLAKHGKVAQITLKGGSKLDTDMMSTDYQG